MVHLQRCSRNNCYHLVDYNSLALIILSILFINIIKVHLAGCVCPNANAIKPCICDEEGLQCLKLNSTGDLERVFSAQSTGRKAIRRVWILQTNLSELSERAFGDYIMRDLYLDLNQIRSIKRNAFGEAARTLQSLSLTRNQLASFPFEDLKSMKRLKQLGLGHNKLTKVSSHELPVSDVLELLDLSHNLINLIEPFSFVDLHEVSLIDLSRNKLETIQSNSLLVKSSSRHLAVSVTAPYQWQKSEKID